MIRKYYYHTLPVRVLTLPEGRFVVADDVASAIGIKGSSGLTRHLEEGTQKRHFDLHTGTVGTPKRTIVAVEALEEMLARTTKDSSDFRAWFAEALAGKLPQEEEPLPEDPGEPFHLLLGRLKSVQEELARLQAEMNELVQKVYDRMIAQARAEAGDELPPVEATPITRNQDKQTRVMLANLLRRAAARRAQPEHELEAHLVRLYRARTKDAPTGLFDELVRAGHSQALYDLARELFS